ncbi:MAG: mdtA [Gammaproteobacteria bacterium]|nr:mdtA [Gammaproteobacteria bacterium]
MLIGQYMKLRTKKIGVAIVSLLVIYLIFAVVYQRKTDKFKQQAVAVTIQTVKQKDVEQPIQVVGTVQAHASVAIKAQVSGILAKISFQEGKDVKANDELFQIDPRPFAIDLQQAKADLAKDKALLENARSLYNRYAKLIKKGFVAQDVYNQARSNVITLEATVAADQAKVEAAQLKLDYSIIRSPISGRTGNIVLPIGNLVKDNDSTPLVVINQIQPITIAFTIAEQYLPKIQQNLAKGAIPLTALIGKDKNIVEQGELASINNTIDAATGTILLKGTFANAKNLLWPGQFVTVVMPLAKYPNALVIPTKAIEQGQQGAHVYLIDDKHIAQYQPVKTGVTLGDETVILSGLHLGDRVVTDGQFRLAPGKPVLLSNPPK